jgi:hypothetical protein
MGATQIVHVARSGADYNRTDQYIQAAVGSREGQFIWRGTLAGNP